MPISPKADVTVSAAEGYTFDYWTIDGIRKDFSEAMTQLKTETYTQDTTFTAYFDVDGKGGTDPENPDLENIEDDEEYEIAADAFDEWLDEQEFEEDLDAF